VPFVVETSIGCDRMFLAMMANALQEETVPDADGKDSTRIVLKLPAAIAPVKVFTESYNHISTVSMMRKMRSEKDIEDRMRSVLLTV